MATVMVDGALVKIHQHSAGAPKADALTVPDASRAAQAIGVIRGGLTAQIVVLVEKAGRLAGFALTTGSAREPDSLPALLAGVPASALIANKAYEANATLSLLDERDIATVMLSRENRKASRWYDRP